MEDAVDELHGHPAYQAQPLGTQHRNIPDDYGGPGNVRMVGAPTIITSGEGRQIFRAYVRSILNSMTDGFEGWEPEDDGHEDIVFEAHAVAMAAGVRLTCAEGTEDKSTCDYYFMHQEARAVDEEEAPLPPPKEENENLKHIPRDYEFLVDDFLFYTYVCKVQKLFIAVVPDGRDPLRLAVVRKWPVHRHPLSPRYIGLWIAEDRKVEDELVMIIPEVLTKVTAYDPRAFSEDQHELHGSKAGTILFSEVRAKSGKIGHRGADADSSSSSDDDDDGPGPAGGVIVA